MRTILAILGIAFVIVVVVHVYNGKKDELVQKNIAANPGIDWTSDRVAQLKKLSLQELRDCLNGKINIQIS